ENRNTIFISGQLPINPKTGEMKETIKEQTEQSLRNIKAIVEASNMTLSHIVKNTIYVTSLQNAAEVNEVYATFFGESTPARAMVGVKELPKNAQIEVESIAMR